MKTIKVTLRAHYHWYVKPLLYVLVILQFLIDKLDELRGYIDSIVYDAINVDVIEESDKETDHVAP